MPLSEASNGLSTRNASEDLVTLSFGAFEIDPALRELRHDGRQVVVQPLVFDLLLHFVRNPNAVVTKEALIRDVWKGVVVGDGAITQAISLLRRTLRPGDTSPPLLRTVWGRGYRFVANVRATENDAPVAEGPGTARATGRTPFVGRADVMGLLERAL
jgi:DNA-binding winged helix-turn-helix (wHTH) protein